MNPIKTGDILYSPSSPDFLELFVSQGTFLVETLSTGLLCLSFPPFVLFHPGTNTEMLILQPEKLLEVKKQVVDSALELKILIIQS